MYATPSHHPGLFAAMPALGGPRSVLVTLQATLR